MPPQSVVVVPAKAPFEVGQEIFVRHEVNWATESENVWPGIGWPEGHTPENCLFVAAPAPSSLAGGEVQEAAERLRKAVAAVRPVNVLEASRLTHVDDDETAKGLFSIPKAHTAYADLLWHATHDLPIVLAALSPEAPARVDARGICEALGFDPTNHHNAAACPYCIPDEALRNEIKARALTPRHEAPADPCAPHRSMGFHIDPCCPHCEAPAEGAGEVERKAIARIIFPESERVKMDREWGGNRNHSRNRWKLALEQADAIIALRARSSAPEAREPVAWLLENHGSGTGPICRDHPGEWPNTTVYPLFKHPAAPSEDKLRIAVEAMLPVARSNTRLGKAGAELRAHLDAIDQALAALKAEDAT